MQPVTPKDPMKIYTASKMRVHVTPKKFTPDLQIFYTFPVFGLNVKKFTPDVKKFTPDLQIFYTFPVFGLNVKKFTPDVKKFTPDLQIFYTFPVFGLNVKVFGVKVPPMKRIIFIKLYPTSKTRMLLSENLPQTSRFFTRIYPPYPCHYATLISSKILKQ